MLENKLVDSTDRWMVELWERKKVALMVAMMGKNWAEVKVESRVSSLADKWVRR
jgi:hypothetical protein